MCLCRDEDKRRWRKKERKDRVGTKFDAFGGKVFAISASISFSNSFSCGALPWSHLEIGVERFGRAVFYLRNLGPILSSSSQPTSLMSVYSLLGFVQSQIVGPIKLDECKINGPV